MIKTISVTDIPGFQIGQAENQEAATGVTVILAQDSAPAGMDIRGGGPASRETGLLDPIAACDAVNAVVLSGGSAYGLNCAGGVMRYLEERGIGFQTEYGCVPLVCASCIFDLGVGDPKVRPDEDMAYQACVNAPNFKEGNYGAGTGATVGKAAGSAFMMNSGIGSAAVQVGDLMVGAIVAVNALGDIYDPVTGRKLAGQLSKEGTLDASSEDTLIAMAEQLAPHANTTIGVILTNAQFDKTMLTKIAGMGHDGMARAIRPVHTMFDGDTLYALSGGHVPADVNVVGALAAKVTAQAIDHAVLHTTPLYGLKCAADFIKEK
ncbi:MAG: P1 family peptidase [Catenisphaera adipataccumulans]|jgi:L-aminopeptidase/D-esterase-like protein|uniref:P1 family peptidase n=1 Tax=Catenisphaera adipataccumulans TaxID=700500 RepID=UPI003D89C449